MDDSELSDDLAAAHDHIEDLGALPGLELGDEEALGFPLSPTV